MAGSSLAMTIASEDAPGFTREVLTLCVRMTPGSCELLVLLFLLAFVAGVVDTIAGGGGLLVVPGLMASGLDPVSAFATNKLQAIFGTASATIQFWRKGKVRLRDHIFPAATAFLTAICGAASVSYLDPGLLKNIVPFALIFIALLLLLKPSLGEAPRKTRESRLIGALIIIPLIGFYDGFLGPGTGTFFAIGAVMVLGASLEEATIRAKIYNFASNLGGLLYFIGGGHPSWTYGAVMATGTLIGGNLGARLILRHGVGLIKPLVVATSIAISIRLIWQQGTILEVSKIAASRLEGGEIWMCPLDRKARPSHHRGKASANRWHRPD